MVCALIAMAGPSARPFALVRNPPSDSGIAWRQVALAAATTSRNGSFSRPVVAQPLMRIPCALMRVQLHLIAYRRLCGHYREVRDVLRAGLGLIGAVSASASSSLWTKQL